ncbi:DinB family protein [Chitinophaga polysaccharea]|uniref:DinB family protein n=1 Tax=Chitinophaga polysaccharea TaxID=1293035 RepID=A0A561PP25_9BACT|nr:DinB family protein [Chitinophaga polysaccharea]TWF39871.1 DinB family protein [Chitinophaga polysaccharea]
MNATKQIAKHFRDVHLGGNWTSVNLKDTLAGISREQATTQIDDLNTIAVLVFHINYYVGVITRVLQGGPLEGNDKLSFSVPPISSEEAWQALVNKTITEAEAMTVLIEKLDDATLQENFTDPKYGTYFRNLLGVTEHTHYHLGQIAILKKIIRSRAMSS